MILKRHTFIQFAFNGTFYNQLFYGNLLQENNNSNNSNSKTNKNEGALKNYSSVIYTIGLTYYVGPL